MSLLGPSIFVHNELDEFRNPDGSFNGPKIVDALLKLPYTEQIEFAKRLQHLGRLEASAADDLK
jgi:hypothetical protein